MLFLAFLLFLGTLLIVHGLPIDTAIDADIDFSYNASLMVPLPSLSRRSQETDAECAYIHVETHVSRALPILDQGLDLAYMVKHLA